MKRKQSDPYEVLGVDRDADPASIKRTYRRKARAVHPDKGGSHEEMSALATAYATLSDPDRRARYDETGRDDAAGGFDDEVRNCVIEAFGKITQEILTGSYPASLLAAIKQHSRNVRQQQDAGIADTDAKLRMLREQRDRLIRKDGERNWFHVTIDQIIGQLTEHKATLEHRVEVMEAAIKQLAAYHEVGGKAEGLVRATTSTRPGYYTWGTRGG
jgi:curved DNA-binding protein CbpA